MYQHTSAVDDQSERSEMGYCRHICHRFCCCDLAGSRRLGNSSCNDILTRFPALIESLVSSPMESLSIFESLIIPHRLMSIGLFEGCVQRSRCRRLGSLALKYSYRLSQTPCILALPKFAAPRCNFHCPQKAEPRFNPPEVSEERQTAGTSVESLGQYEI